MPTVRGIGSARFFFYSNEGTEPPHIHVEEAGAVAKFWLQPLSLASSSRFRAHDFVAWNGWWPNITTSSWRHGMSSSAPSVDPRAVEVQLDDDNLTVDLADGRRVTVPLAWFPRLLHANPEQRQNWRLIGDGQGIHWPDVDEDLSVAGLLRGAAAPETSKRAV